MKEVKPITYKDYLPVLICAHLTNYSAFFMLLFDDLKLDKVSTYLCVFFLCFLVWMFGTFIEFLIRVFCYVRYVKKNKKEVVRQ